MVVPEWHGPQSRMTKPVPDELRGGATRIRPAVAGPLNPAKRMVTASLGGKPTVLLEPTGVNVVAGAAITVPDPEPATGVSAATKAGRGPAWMPRISPTFPRIPSAGVASSATPAITVAMTTRTGGAPRR